MAVRHRRQLFCKPGLCITLLFLVGCLLLPTANASNIPPRPAEFPTGTSLLNPGNDLWREVRQRDLPYAGISQVRQVDSGVLINPQGDRWARFRVTRLVNYSGIAIVAIFVVLLAFFSLRGKIMTEGGPSGQMVKRYTDYERVVHWTLAIVFLFLAITGLLLLLGRPLLIPLLGKDVFSVMASASKEGHNLFGPLFAVSLIMLLISFWRRNFYASGDLGWLLKGGGLIGKGHVSGGFFNMGEKIWFWLVILVGLALSVSGLILVSPNFGQGRVVMELTHVVHVICAMILIIFACGHMYLGSIGHEGVLEGMKTGYVDINWADAHHDRWGRECRDRGRVVSAEDYARIQGKTPRDIAEPELERGK